MGKPSHPYKLTFEERMERLREQTRRLKGETEDGAIVARFGSLAALWVGIVMVSMAVMH